MTARHTFSSGSFEAGSTLNLGEFQFRLDLFPAGLLDLPNGLLRPVPRPPRGARLFLRGWGERSDWRDRGEKRGLVRLFLRPAGELEIFFRDDLFAAAIVFYASEPMGNRLKEKRCF